MSITWLTDAGGLAEPVQMDGSAKETWARDKISCSVQLKCPWGDRYKVLDNILTYARAWPYHAPVEIAFAISGGIANFASPSTGNGSGLDYDDAILEVSFESFNKKSKEDPADVPIYDESLEPTAEFLTLPPDNFKWHDSVGAALKKEEAPGRLCIGLDYVVSWSNLSVIPAQAMSLIGKVNSVAVRSPSLGLTFDVETLLFNPPKISRKISTRGTNKFTMQVRFTHKPDGWNKFWRASKAGGAGWDEIYDTVAAAAYKNFQPAAFTNVVP